MDILMKILRTILNVLKAIFKWIFSHKLIVFVYIPFVSALLIGGYVFYVYMTWQGDKDMALTRLASYKKLIDRTEEMRKGYVYSYSDIDVSAKVVDIPTRIYDRNNEVIGEFFEQKREIVPFDYIPQWIKKGVIASEDREFYNHKGVNYMGIVRAMIKNILSLRIAQGGSTITQQLSKVLFTKMERSLKRKIYELFCAHEIERKYDKEDILSMYLNLIYFGKGAYGVESTSKMYFGKSVKTLNESECAMIVATISSPRRYSPLSNLDNSVKKTKRILKSMVDAGFVNQKKADYQYKKFLSKWDVKYDKKGKTISSLIGSFVQSSYRVNRAPFFNELIRRKLVKKFGETAVKKGGLSVYTTIDANKQDVGLKALRAGVNKQRKYHTDKAKKIRNKAKAKKEKEKSENIEGALIALDPATGEIVTYVGGSEFSFKNQNDSVSQGRRQPGSSFKPIMYVSAIENGDITPSTVFVDEKVKYGKWSPRNYSKKYAGKMIVREALRKSVNVVAVKVLDKTGYDKLFDILSNGLDLDSSGMKKRFMKTLSMALGTYELSPIENCRLHCSIANGGDYIIPYGIKFVKDYSGNIIWNNEEEVLQKLEEKRKSLGKIIDPRAAAVIVGIMKGVFEKGGTAYWSAKSRNIKFPIAGKTGTSTNFNDAWFVGYTSQLVTAVWVGNKAGSISLGRGRAGGSVSAPIWADYISTIFRETPPPDFPVPEEGLTRENICIESGMVANQGECPVVSEGQLYYAGTEPGDYCKIHEKKEEAAPGVQ
ncbi:MAG: PBP1A family penicillin-binding protein [bacterium]|nr:PBP1A family penicillin-binding protein [bacterium]